MGVIIGQSTTGSYSTWAKLRCPLIGAYDKFELTPHNLIIDSGFSPEEGLFVRVFQWPYQAEWMDTSGNIHMEHAGPIVGFRDGAGEESNPSYFSVGGYDVNRNDQFNPNYSSINNFLDLVDIEASLVGLEVTYDSTATFTANPDAFENDPPSTPWFGQDIGLVSISSVTAIEGFTAF